MIIGTTLMAKPASATEVYSPWFPRGGDAATFVIDVIAIDNATIAVSAYTKNTDNVDPGSSASGSSISESATTGASGASARVTNLKELVRFKYALTADPGTDGFVHFRMREPSWETN